MISDSSYASGLLTKLAWSAKRSRIALTPFRAGIPTLRRIGDAGRVRKLTHTPIGSETRTGRPTARASPLRNAATEGPRGHSRAM